MLNGELINLFIVQGLGSEVNQSHFGINFVANYERIGDRPWERFDEVQDSVSSQTLRYPGGITSETLIDISNPDQDTVINESGEERALVSLPRFLAHCNETGANPTIIIPTAQLLSDTRIDGHRTFNQSLSDEVKAYVSYVLSLTNPSLQISFELGNEYEAHMTSREYGRIANEVTLLIEEAIAEYIEAGGRIDIEPEIFVQVWAQSAGGGMSYDDLENRNEVVLSEFSNEALQHLDGVVSHLYYTEGRGSGTEYEHSINNISTIIDRATDLHATWSEATGRDLESRFSEWNVQHHSQANYGLEQTVIMLEMFTSFLEEGVDALDFWSSQYHATSLADRTGELQLAGEFFRLMNQYLHGTQAMPTASLSTEYILNGFSNNSEAVFFISSTIENSATHGLDFSDITPGFQLVEAFIFGVDETTADGNFGSLSGFLPYEEPDVDAMIRHLTFDNSTTSNLIFDLDPYETAILVFSQITIPGYNTVSGTSEDDYLMASSDSTLYFGGSGGDTVSYANSAQGIVAMLGHGQSGIIDGSGDRFESVENIVGSDEDDLISGNHAANSLYGGGGDDELVGGAGNDTLDGGEGDDYIAGGGGHDIIYVSAGQDTVYGGNGNDQLSFSLSNSAVHIDCLEGAVETESGLVRFSEFEIIEGSEFNDRITGGLLAARYLGGGGDDHIVVFGSGDYVDAGNGDDIIFVHGASSEIYLGDGSDWLFMYGTGVVDAGEGDDFIFLSQSSDRAEVSGGDDLYVGTEEISLIFSSTSGHDRVVGFQPEQDQLLLQGVDLSVVTLQYDGDNTLLEISDSSSIMLIGCHITFDDIVFS